MQKSEQLPNPPHLRYSYPKKAGLSPKAYPSIISFLFFVMAIYLVLPLVDIPLLGLSISAPIFGIIALQVFLKPTEPWLSRFKKWIALATLFWIALFISTMANGLLTGGENIDREGWVSLVQYAFWMLVFVVTAYFASRNNLLERVAFVLGWGIFLWHWLGCLKQLPGAISARAMAQTSLPRILMVFFSPHFFHM